MVDSWNPAQLNEAVNNGSIGGSGSDLPEVSASDNGDVLTVVNGAWDKATPTGGAAYPGTATVIGKYADGTTDVYRKTYTGTVGDTGTTVIDDDVSGKTIVGCNAFIYDTSGLGTSLGAIPNSGTWVNCLHVNASHELCLMSESAVVGGSYVVTIDYIVSV